MGDDGHHGDGIGHARIIIVGDDDRGYQIKTHSRVGYGMVRTDPSRSVSLSSCPIVEDDDGALCRRCGCRCNNTIIIEAAS
eukprot:scaffold34705_cov215-Amphora_coffeaeformis.AAC.1